VQVKGVACGYRKTIIRLVCAAKRNHSLTGSAAKRKAGKKRVVTVGALRFHVIKREAVYGMQP